MDIKEFEISVPWGHIAVKAWGDERNKAIVMVHGLNDNAGSFDRIIPHLSKHYYYVCVDLPGHGKSSHFPKSAPLQELNLAMSLKIVVDSLKQKKIIMIAHGWGAQLSSLFAQLYPEIVEKLILIEGVCLRPLSVDYFRQFTTDFIEKSIHILNKSMIENPTKLTYEKALDLTINERENGKLNKEAAAAILKRHLKKVGNDQYTITRDLRNNVRYSLFITKDYALRLFEEHNITCPVLFIFSKHSAPLMEDNIDIINVIKQSNHNCTIKELGRDQDMHCNLPELVAPTINEFLHKFNSNL
ncbi:hypothetical protein FQR65_LT08142 [Abscondita terminalis]|nr:hypothetical protein FQR65_LT08142 [Abscondita terminalis]